MTIGVIYDTIYKIRELTDRLDIWEIFSGVSHTEYALNDENIDEKIKESKILGGLIEGMSDEDIVSIGYLVRGLGNLTDEIEEFKISIMVER